MSVRKQLPGAFLGAIALLLASSAQGAVITASGAFDLTSLRTANVSSITPLSYEASAENSLANSNLTGTTPVSALVDTDFKNGSASATADAADLSPSALTVSADAFDAGNALASLSYDFSYEITADGPVSIAIDYSALYDLDGSSIANTLISLMMLDSFSGGFDQAALLPGDPAFAFGTLSVDYSGAEGDTGVITLLASAAADSGVEAVPLPNTLVVLALGLAAMLGARKR
ncbi:MAG: hypothetical protein GVY09_01515 [Gammaproteobacteria bacterium]|jgi:hypothetical protein|nr:hypothetical protein [Gammaproteobacteria bacterium]